MRDAFVHEGFLPYTKAGVIEAAFKFLGTPYSWGGGKEGEDCSSFLKALFGMFGVELPRNSSTQSAVGRMILRNTVIEKSLGARRALAKEWVPGITLLRPPDHIMLYLGEHDGRRYAIHSVWEVSSDGGLARIAGVAVTALDLGSGSEKARSLRGSTKSLSWSRRFRGSVDSGATSSSPSITIPGVTSVSDRAFG
ncbi:MAG: NlpC/P60 family protein [Thermodesulfobacteriota bacterium]